MENNIFGKHNCDNCPHREEGCGIEQIVKFTRENPEKAKDIILANAKTVKCMTTEIFDIFPELEAMRLPLTLIITACLIYANQNAIGKPIEEVMPNFASDTFDLNMN